LGAPLVVTKNRKSLIQRLQKKGDRSRTVACSRSLIDAKPLGTQGELKAIPKG